MVKTNRKSRRAAERKDLPVNDNEPRLDLKALVPVKVRLLAASDALVEARALAFEEAAQEVLADEPGRKNVVLADRIRALGLKTLCDRAVFISMDGCGDELSCKRCAKAEQAKPLRRRSRSEGGLGKPWSELKREAPK